MIQRKQKYRGFTLIEVMAVIAIISIMTAILLVSFDGTKKQTNLDNASRQFVTDLSFLQKSALSGTVPPGVTGSVCGHGLHRTGSGGYEFFVIEKSEVSNDCTETSYSRTYDSSRDSIYGTKVFEKGVILENSAQDLYFEVPHAKVYYNNSIANAPYTLSLDGENLSVCVTASGEIKEGDC